MGSIDQLIPDDHRVRLVWDFLQQLDLSGYLKTIKSVKGCAGRPATHPKIITAIRLYGTIQGIASAFQLAELCKEYHTYIWLCGGTEIGRKTLTNFRAEQGELFNRLLAQSVGIMLHNGLISLEEVRQDCMRVRAHAISSFFRTLPTLKERVKAIENYVRALQKEEKRNPGKARERAEKELRISTTDPQVRKMKMGCGGYRPAFNVQFASTVKGRVIIAADVTNKGSDYNRLAGMFKKVVETYKIVSKTWLADAGYNTGEQIEVLEAEGCKTYISLKPSKTKDIYAPKKGESKALAARRERMGTNDAKEKYKLRSQTAEFPNAEARNHGMQQFLVQGINKALNVCLIFALTHNFMRLNNLRSLFG